MTLPIQYDVSAVCEEQELLIEWENPGKWIARFKETFDNAESISLVPRNCTLPKVTVALGDRRRWIIFTRVLPFGAALARFYAIGWQTTVRGLNVKSIVWVYPDGCIKVTEELPNE